MPTSVRHSLPFSSSILRGTSPPSAPSAYFMPSHFPLRFFFSFPALPVSSRFLHPCSSYPLLRSCGYKYAATQKVIRHARLNAHTTPLTRAQRPLLRCSCGLFFYKPYKCKQSISLRNVTFKNFVCVCMGFLGFKHLLVFTCRKERERRETKRERNTA